MNLNDISSLPIFFDNLKIVLGELGYCEYNQTKSCDKDFYGKFFYRENFYFWVGDYLTENSIYIGFKDHDNWIQKEVRSKIKEMLGKTNSEYFDAPVKDPCGNYGDFWFKMNGEKFKLLCDKSVPAEKQKMILKNFCESVFKALHVKTENKIL